MGLSNAGFLFLTHYSPLMVLVRLVQGVAFGACFNACATAVVDIVEPAKRAQGIGLFGVSGSLAVAVGPYIGELFLTRWGHTVYFTLLMGFGVIGALFALAVKEPPQRRERPVMSGFFNTAFEQGYPAMMAMAVVFGSGFAAMNNFLPLQARSMGFSAGIFFVCYGVSLIAVRIFLGTLLDRVNRDRIILACLVGFGVNLGFTSQIHSVLHVCLLGALFGVVQGISYPAMMARMVDRSNENNRAVVVALFTGSFGVGINLSVLVWGVLADLGGLPFMFMAGSALMFAGAVGSVFLFSGKRRLPECKTAP
jgi:predicted MFS family arabinose efflux permease